MLKPIPCPRCGMMPEIDTGFSDAPYPPGQEYVSCPGVRVGIPGVVDQSCGTFAIGVAAWNYRAIPAADARPVQDDAASRRRKLLGYMDDKSAADARAEAHPTWNGPGEKPHAYSPDYMAMGDCRICGHTREAYDTKPDARAENAPCPAEGFGVPCGPDCHRLHQEVPEKKPDARAEVLKEAAAMIRHKYRMSAMGDEAAAAILALIPETKP